MAKRYSYYILRPEVEITSFYDLYDTYKTNCYTVDRDYYDQYMCSLLKDHDLFVHHVRDIRAPFILTHQFGDDKIYYQGFMKLES